MHPLPQDKKTYWSPADAEQTRIFLDSAAGQRFLARLMYRTPEYKAFTNIEERAVTSGKLEGYGECVKEILTLRSPDPEQKSQ
jgi:hypothetical protein